ncbi:uncharacterized protein LOC115672740 [Syzygium oleosum]|uniref:uncharacterized protein LOC115672740 n=1 Tax=Syzygium oleosum TaxID=219896 RepID=UPI0011D18075|nr:uncharacterized protein LOC115672740 [Syzygium oleosum]
MACSSSPPSFCRVKGPACTCRHKTSIMYPRVISRSFKDEGKAANMVDANLDVLRQRIDEVRQRERLKDHPRGHQNGWNYHPHVHGYDTQIVNRKKKKKKAMLVEAMELVILASSSLGLVLLCGSLCMCLVSFLVRLNY